METMDQVWLEICNYCKTRVNEVTFKVWFKDLKLLDLTGGEAVLFIKTEFQKKIILENYEAILEEAFLNVLSFAVKIRIKTEADMETSPLSAVVKDSSQYEYTFDTFIVGSSNRFAHAASQAVAEKPGMIYNPLFIYGNSGLGKTHLLSAIAARIKETYPEKNIVFINCEAFANDFIHSLHYGNINQFREKYRMVDVLLIDDIQFIAGKESTEEEFFNTFNALYNSQKQIICSSDRPPKDIPTLSDRMRGRFEAGLLADVQPPEFETRVGVLKRKAQFVDLNLSDDIIYYIAEQVKSDIRQLEGVIKKIKAHSLLDSDITISVAQAAIRDIRNNNQPEPVTVRKIIEEVSRTYSISADDILGTRQDAAISYARQISMYIVREVTDMPYKKIGEEFGGKNHSTVLYACNVINKAIEKNSKEKDRISDIMRNLQNQ